MSPSQSHLEKVVTIYTDGGAEPNPGPGGYGVVLKFGKYRREKSGGFQCTTNNRMELMAVIVGLEALNQPCRVTLYSDSQYIVTSMSEGHAWQWKKRGWRRLGSGKTVKNPDLWERLLLACELHEVTFAWVRGHSGNFENERCDQLAGIALQKDGLPQDIGYLQPMVLGSEEIALDFGEVEGKAY